MDHEASDFYIYLKEIKIPQSGKSEIKSKSEKNCSYLKASWTKWAGRASQELTRNIWAVPTVAKSSSSSSSYSQAKTGVLVLLILCLLCVYIYCARKVQFLLITTISVFHITQSLTVELQLDKFQKELFFRNICRRILLKASQYCKAIYLADSSPLKWRQNCH